MQAGRLRHRVTIEKPVTTVNATGERVATWVSYGDRWASIEPMQGREYFSASQIQSSVNTRIRVRYDAGINETMRVKFVADRASGLTHYYDIEAALPIKERRHEMQLMCIRRGAEGFRSGV